jgi:toxin FitB
VIVLDTNVVSESMRAHPDLSVIAWLDRQVAETLFLTAVSLAELLAGVERLPAGRRRQNLHTALADLVDTLFGPRVLPFDEKAARSYAGIATRASLRGRALSFADGQIAAITSCYGFSIATRDTAPFAAAELPAINPWRD